MSDVSALFDDPQVEGICGSSHGRVVVYRRGLSEAGSLTEVPEAELGDVVAGLAERRGGG
jgi:hypothetical protein